MKQIIILRTDLGMRKGKMVAQGCHVSVLATVEILESMHWDVTPFPKKWQQWYKEWVERN